MSRVKQRYKLPRNWIAIPLFLYTIIFIISIGVISISFETFSEYSSTLKARAETEKVSHYAELYDTAQEGSSDQLLSYFKEQGYDCIVFNNNKTILRANSEPTAILDKYASGDVNKTSSVTISFLMKDEEEDYAYLYYPDKEGNMIIVEDDVVKPDIMEILLHGPLDFYKNLENHEINYIPYWTSFKVRDGKESIAFKTHLDLSINDVGYFSLNFFSAYLLVILIFILLVSNIIRTHRNNRNMRKIVFRDNITGSRNWFWFALKSPRSLSNK